MAHGSFITYLSTFILSAFLTAISIRTENRIYYNFIGALRQTAWLAFPGFLVGDSMHYFLSEAMWSGRRNSWGQAWAKAIFLNSLIWGAAVGVGTLVWRRLLPLTAAGRRIYHRYPIPSDYLDLRVLRSSGSVRELVSGMGWSYWVCGIGMGQAGLATVVMFCCWINRPYMMMAPNGGYARKCMPAWRREQFASTSNTLTDTK
ncbi:unnamed protein product [Phytomonas sp. Hart1]|nr:unnamed protein product [Phytomonas sp. Hart1]|eukprot:CCW69460.1 unnamed protein product [Phytomonas sp. isolate Hart1]